MRKRHSIPHTYVIIFVFIILAAIATWAVPAGEFEHIRKQLSDGTSKMIVVKDSYHSVEQSPQTWQILTSILNGFVKQADIIVFILLIGGAFWIMNTTKAIDTGIMAFIAWTRKLEKIKLLRYMGINTIILTMIMLMFSLFGAVFGMSEETIAFVIILVPLAISMGYDSITGICIVYVAAHVGFAGAMLNPFTIGIAQGLADLPIFSGLEYRIVCWFIINVVGFTCILLYARKIKLNPQKSIMYEADAYWRNKEKPELNSISYYTPISAWISFGLTAAVLIMFSFYHSNSVLTIGNSNITMPAVPVATIVFILSSVLTLRKTVHFYILNLLAFTIVFLIIGVVGYRWYVIEIGALFMTMGLLSGIAVNHSANDIAKLFIEGAKDIFSAAFIVGLAGGIIIILDQGKIIDTVMYSLSQAMQELGRTGTMGAMYGIQTLLNIVIPSGSAKAALTMPIMAPFSDLVGISRQATVLAFQFGDGITNMITPTSGVLIGCLGIARIPYEKWFRWVWKFILLLVVLGFLLLIPALYYDI